MREQAREQAKASRITRAASIDMIGSASQDLKRWVSWVVCFVLIRCYLVCLLNPPHVPGAREHLIDLHVFVSLSVLSVCLAVHPSLCVSSNMRVERRNGGDGDAVEGVILVLFVVVGRTITPEFHVGRVKLFSDGMLVMLIHLTPARHASPLPPPPPPRPALPCRSSKKKIGLFKRSQSYNDASRMARGRSYNEDDDYDDDGDEDFLADLPPGDGRGGGLRAGGGRLAARGRKFLMRISTRSGSTCERGEGEGVGGKGRGVVGVKPGGHEESSLM